MTEWGRNAGIAAGTPREGWSRAGKSIVCAMLALGGVLVPVGVLTALPADVPEFVSSLVTIVVALAFLVAAPVLHIVGAIFGFMGVFGDSNHRVLAAFGLFLNLGLLALGVFLALMASSSIGAFT